MASSRPVPTAGAPPPLRYTTPSERHSLKEAGDVRTVSQKAAPPLPWDENSEAKGLDHEENCLIGEAADLDHEEKVNKYQAMLATRLKAKYFSRNAFDKGLAGDMFEEITIQSETIRMSRWPFTSLFADPAKFCLEKRRT